MQRRALLASLGSLSVAGCISGGDSGRSQTTRTTRRTQSTSLPSPTTESSTKTDRPTTTAADPPENVGIAPTDSDCPAPENADRVVCAGETDLNDAPLPFSASTTSGSLPEATFKFTLRNRSAARFDINFYAWRMWKRVNGEWFHVAPRGWPQPLMMMRPGDSHSWSVTLERDLPNPGMARCCSGGGTKGGTLGGFGGGEYAFLTDGWFAGDSGRRIALVARFELAGDPLVLEPAKIETWAREGDTVTVRSGYDDGDGEMATLVVTRTDADPDRTLIPEQAVRDYRLRNTLPFFDDGVRQVRFRQREGTVPPFGVNDSFVVVYGGERFRVSVESDSEKTTSDESPE
ncbi:hypothetical protein [Haloprofundus salinisoli]|uniref:hypothetical protein n=1 Tax=Haloprofundus salinisoli TaxID=2876193 RepID=UPI001CCCA05B|nr:hypothetical protein [Haloprofundus salinisoli]